MVEIIFFSFFHLVLLFQAQNISYRIDKCVYVKARNYFHPHIFEEIKTREKKALSLVFIAGFYSPSCLVCVLEKCIFIALIKLKN